MVNVAVCNGRNGHGRPFQASRARMRVDADPVQLETFVMPGSINTAQNHKAGGCPPASFSPSVHRNNLMFNSIQYGLRAVRHLNLAENIRQMVFYRFFA